MTDRSFERANRESLDRLTRLVATLTPEQLEVELGEGWTVASALGHMGFWDRWQADRWERMIAGTWNTDAEAMLVAEHLANDALHPYWAGAAAGNVGQLAVEAGAKLDALVAGAPDELIDRWLGTSSAFLVNRHRHRNEHLDHIERSIAAAEAGADRSFAEKNAASRRHLASVVERLRAEDLALPTEPTDEGSWKVVQVLAHILFWDLSMADRWRRALERAGKSGPVRIEGVPAELTDCLNLPLASLVEFWGGRIGLDVGARALAAAETLDRLIEENIHRLPPGALATRPNAAHRFGHREGHLDQIEKALAAARPAAAAADRSYLSRNEASRERLERFLGDLSTDDLSLPAGNRTWTVGQLIGHLAFWDRFLATRWRAVLAGGPGSQPSWFGHDLADLLNTALPASWQALASADPHRLVADAVAAARDVDQVIAGLPSETPIGAILAERPTLLDRSPHRSEHLATIEAALATRGG
jgi:uncharacterized damage-inducible protein DinB